MRNLGIGMLFLTMVMLWYSDESASAAEAESHYSEGKYIVGVGQGDLSKGRVICQRVAELAARADVAKQIRVLVKEHMSDRLQERTGQNAQQDIEIVREEEVNELLRDVKIVERAVDTAVGTCSSMAVMRKGRMASQDSPP
jgi:hypothetical protein